MGVHEMFVNLLPQLQEYEFVYIVLDLTYYLILFRLMIYELPTLFFGNHSR